MKATPKRIQLPRAITSPRNWLISGNPSTRVAMTAKDSTITACTIRATMLLARCPSGRMPRSAATRSIAVPARVG